MRGKRQDMDYSVAKRTESLPRSERWLFLFSPSAIATLPHRAKGNPPACSRGAPFSLTQSYPCSVSFRSVGHSGSDDYSLVAKPISRRVCFATAAHHLACLLASSSSLPHAYPVRSLLKPSFRPAHPLRPIPRPPLSHRQRLRPNQAPYPLLPHPLPPLWPSPRLSLH